MRLQQHWSPTCSSSAVQLSTSRTGRTSRAARSLRAVHAVGARAVVTRSTGPHACGTGHAKLPAKAALTLHAARMTHHACAFAYALKAHAQCSFGLSVTPSALMTSCYTSTILMRSGQHARGRLGAGAMVASSMLHSTIRNASAYNDYMRACAWPQSQIIIP